MIQIFVYALAAVFVGALFPLQAAVNATLGRGVGGPVAATLISFGAGFLFLCAINAAAFRQWHRPAASFDLAAPRAAGSCIPDMETGQRAFVPNRAK